MVKWLNMCVPKDFGGLGIMETRTMNEALVAKWGWRILKDERDDLCSQLLKKKYLRNCSFWQCREGVGSQFWKGVTSTRDKLKWGCKVKINNGQNCRFWEEVWAGSIPLKLEFPSLYDLCNDKNCLVSDCWAGDGWRVEFRRPLGDSDYREWEKLVSMLYWHRLNNGSDHFCWLLEKSGKYTVRSMYRRLVFRGVVNKRMAKLWKSKLPNKLKVFFWLVVQDKLQTGVNLKKREWKGDGKCCLCGVEESGNHIFFNCHIARVIWFCVKEALGWERCPSNLNDFFDNWLVLGSKNYHVKLFMFVIVLWGLWTVRNKMCIEKRFPKSSHEVFDKILQLMQKWRVLLKEQDTRFIDSSLKEVKTWLLKFWEHTESLEVEGVI